MAKVKRPDFAVYNESGELEELYCKLCGTAIAGNVEVLRRRRELPDGSHVEDRVMRFQRFNHYAEIKIEMEDGSFHVTNGCSKCLNKNMKPVILEELHIADMEAAPTAFAERDRMRKPKKVAILDTKKRGIV